MNNKGHLNKNNINDIIFEYLGLDLEYATENLDILYQTIKSVYEIIDKYKNDERNIQYIYQSDYDEGRASDNYDDEDNYTDLEFIENVNGIVVYEKL